MCLFLLSRTQAGVCGQSSDQTKETDVDEDENDVNTRKVNISLSSNSS